MKTMNLKEQLIWDQLNIELKLFSIDPDHNLIHFLLKLESFLEPENNFSTLENEITQLSFNLFSQCKDLPENLQIKKLNEFFFNELQFKIGKKQPNLLLSQLLKSKKSSAITINVLYCFFCTRLNLAVFPINLSSSVLKWVRGGKSSYLNLENNGKLATEKDLVKFLNKSESQKDMFEISSQCDQLDDYLDQLCQSYEKENNYFAALSCLDLLLQGKPSHLPTLKKRSALKQKLGLNKEALKDFNTYASYSEMNTSDKERLIELTELAHGDIHNTSTTIH